MEYTNQIKILLDKYIEGTATAEEQAAIESWYISYSLHLENIEVPQIDAEGDQIEVKKMLMEYAHNSQQFRVYKFWRRHTLVAAAVLLMAFGAWFFNMHYPSYLKTNDSAYQNDIKPGSDGATLRLASGEKILLSQASIGNLSEEAGVAITKSSSGEIVYNIIDPDHSAPGDRNTLSTAKGENYKLILPDGSNVWLNAASSLTFPVSFNNVKQRKVELKGEAYFEIAKDKTRPFLVVSNSQTVEVLGTHFNINSYEDEVAVKTTLIEGSVRIIAHADVKGNNKLKASSFTLIPNQQSVISPDEVKVIPINAQGAVAWTKGMFMFNDEPLESILLKISRWYNVEIEYQDKSLKNESFWGIITKYDNLSKVLHMLEKTNTVKFSIEGEKVIVKKNK